MGDSPCSPSAPLPAVQPLRQQLTISDQQSQSLSCSHTGTVDVIKFTNLMYCCLPILKVASRHHYYQICRYLSKCESAAKYLYITFPQGPRTFNLTLMVTGHYFVHNLVTNFVLASMYLNSHHAGNRIGYGGVRRHGSLYSRLRFYSRLSYLPPVPPWDDDTTAGGVSSLGSLYVECQFLRLIQGSHRGLRW